MYTPNRIAFLTMVLLLWAAPRAHASALGGDTRAAGDWLNDFGTLIGGDEGDLVRNAMYDLEGALGEVTNADYFHVNAERKGNVRRVAISSRDRPVLEMTWDTEAGEGSFAVSAELPKIWGFGREAKQKGKALAAHAGTEISFSQRHEGRAAISADERMDIAASVATNQGAVLRLRGLGAALDSAAQPDPAVKALQEGKEISFSRVEVRRQGGGGPQTRTEHKVYVRPEHGGGFSSHSVSAASYQRLQERFKVGK